MQSLPEADRLLHKLAACGGAAQGVPLTLIAKRLGTSVSALVRAFTVLSDARLGGSAGPGWVRIECEASGHWVAHLTESGVRRVNNSEAPP